MLRRQLLQYIASSSLLLCELLKPITALAKWNQPAFSADHLQTAINLYFNNQTITPSDQIKIGINPIIENGAVVPIKIETSLAHPESITIFVEKNPNPLIANFDLAPVCAGFISTRIKVDQSSNVIAIVKANGEIFSQKTFIQVHAGGCS